MQAMMNSMLQMYRQQLDAMQTMASASLSGFERAQQSALEICKQAVGQQLDAMGRVNEQTTQTVLDPQQARPAVEGMIRAQRDIVQAMAETQRRIIDSITATGNGQQAGDLTTNYIDTVRCSIDQWQQFAQQLFQVAREKTEQLSSEAQRNTQHAAGAVHRATDQVSDASRRVAAAAKQRPDQSQANRARATESA
jgi:gas vesicle protein